MKGTDNFKEIIDSHLNGLAEKDELFRKALMNPKKKIDDCITYILNTVKDTKASGFIDAEIFGMAVHYYDEESIDIGKEIKMEVIVNRHVELTVEEKAKYKQEAIDKVFDEQRESMQKKKIVKKPPVIVNKSKDKPNAPSTEPQISLF